MTTYNIQPGQVGQKRGVCQIIGLFDTIVLINGRRVG